MPIPVQTFFRNLDRSEAVVVPFDGTLVTAAAGRIPLALTVQLKSGRRLVIPVG